MGKRRRKRKKEEEEEKKGGEEEEEEQEGVTFSPTLNFFKNYFLKKQGKKIEKSNPGGTRTLNLLIRSQAPYHWATRLLC